MFHLTCYVYRRQVTIDIGNDRVHHPFVYIIASMRGISVLLLYLMTCISKGMRLDYIIKSCLTRETNVIFIARPKLPKEEDKNDIRVLRFDTDVPKGDICTCTPWLPLA